MENNEKLIDVLNDLKTQLKRQTSLRFVFVRGLVYGLGTVIGATVLIGIFGWALTALLNDAEEAPIIGPALERQL